MSRNRLQLKMESLEARMLLEASAELSHLNDEFDDGQISSDWQRIHEFEGWNADQLQTWEETDGQMVMVPHTSTWFEDRRGAMAFKEVTGDFVVTSRVHISDLNPDPDDLPSDGTFSLGGLMIRAPRSITQPSEWTPGGENYVFLSLGYGSSGNQFQLEAKTTIDSVSNLQLIDVGTSEITIQVARIGGAVMSLYQIPGQDWVVHRRYDRSDFPETLQVGMVAYTDWGKASQFPVSEHNSKVLNASVDPNYSPSIGFNPDLIARYDYIRFHRPMVPAEYANTDLVTSDPSIPASFLGDNVDNCPPTPSPLPRREIGINLDGVSDWSTAWMFTDIFQHSRDWISHEVNTVTSPNTTIWNGFAEVLVDENNWPTELREWDNENGERMQQRLGTLMFRDHDHYPAGTYRAEWEGTATLAWGFAASLIEQGTTDDGRHYALLDVSPNNGGIYMRVDAMDANDPLRNVHVWMPDYESESFAGQIWQPGADFSPFHPLFLERLEPFSTLRFMDPNLTNTNTIENWSDRLTPQHARQSGTTEKGLAYEYMIELGNELDANIWLNMPFAANDDYIRNVATLVRDTFDPTQKVYVEWANEIWNAAFGFEGYRWVSDQINTPTGIDFELLRNDSPTFASNPRFVGDVDVTVVDFNDGRQVTGWTAVGDVLDTLDPNVADVYTGTAPVINHHDPDRGICCGAESSELLAFPGLDDGLDNDHLATRFEGTISVPADGIYTFHVQSNEGVRLTVENADFTIHSSDNLSRTSVTNFGQTVVGDFFTPNSNVAVTTFLTAGEHSLVMDQWEGWINSYAQLYVATGTPNPTQDRFEFVAQETKRDFEIWSDVFAGQEHRLVRVVGAQAANDWIVDQIVQHLDGQFDAISPAGYVGLTRDQENAFAQSTLTVTDDDILDAMFQNLPTTLEYLADHQALAEQYSQTLGREIQLVTYEGGQHLTAAGQNNLPYQQALFDAQVNPRMHDLYTDLLEGFHEMGGELFNHFNYSSPSSRFGSWGSMEYQDQPLAEAPKYRALVDFEAANPPRISSVKVSDPAWSDEFRDAVDFDGIGYAIPSGSAQLDSLPWRVRQIIVEFSEDVTGVGPEAFELYGVSETNYESQIVSVEYNHQTHRATVNLQESILADKLLLVVRDTIQDSSGIALDGEWENGQTQTGSGDGIASGDFHFRFNVLAGDIDQSGGISVADVVGIRNDLGFSTSNEGYSIFSDLNSSGAIAVTDLGQIRTALGTLLPIGEPQTTLPARPLLLSKNVDAAIDELLGELTDDDRVGKKSREAWIP